MRKPSHLRVGERVTTSAASRELQVSRHIIADAVRAGEISGIRLTEKGFIWVDVDEVRRWVKSKEMVEMECA